ncbi:MAG: cell division topological specificity factor MinE [Armatimonadota bacterium]
MIGFLRKFTFIQKILGIDGESGKVAKDRLKLVLIHDRSSISPQLMENLKYDLIGIISKYMVIDEESIEMGLDNKNGTVALAANIPILKIKSLDGDSEQLELIKEEQKEVKKEEKLVKEEEKPKTTPKRSPKRQQSYSSMVKTRRRSYKNYRSKKKVRKASIST